MTPQFLYRLRANLPSKDMSFRLPPALALEYVMFHEMLHLRYPVDHNGVRRRVHTLKFREAEKKFPQIKEAKELLKRL